MSLFSVLVLASSLLHIASAAPTLVTRSISCPASNNTVFVTGSNSYTIECGIDRLAGDMATPNGQYAVDLESCVAQCEARAGCVLVDYVPGPKACYLKSTVGQTIANSGVIGARLGSPSSPATMTPVEASASSRTFVSSIAPATAASVPVSTGGGKRGLCYNNPALTKLFGGSGSKVTWMYDWAAATSGGPNSGLKYIPMLWSNSADRAAAWDANAKAGIAGGADALLGFNEPDHGEQANMAVSAAVSGWKTNMEPFYGKAKLISPAVTNGGSPMGLTYLSNFVSQCTDCHIDACAIHWYDSATNIAYFKAYIPQAREACGGKPLWITEFGASGTDEQIVTFLQTVLPWLDSLDYVERYAYFFAAASTNGQYLVNSAGTGLSTIGEVFNSY
ncbi:hypothetical protein FKW77_010142 [Venturia effusa]|uniref:Asl1-like glycosyl hydrolase catalytic domain-containing protein n=1 Tax=Venturia effusa TaxID=50376 RepID=A0A517L297_9PEZI|nr:hypothetical protein FKW77_010142 [Venturia effusa]